MSSDANAANSSTPSKLSRQPTPYAGPHLFGAFEQERQLADLRTMVEVERTAIARLSETVSAQAADIKRLKEAVDKHTDNAKQQEEELDKRLGRIEKMTRGHAPIIDDLEERVEHLEYIVPERDCSDDDSDRVSIRSIIDVDAPADQVGQGAAEVPDRALSDVAEEAAPEGVAAGPAPVLPAAVAEAALAVLPADTLPAATVHAGTPKRCRDEDSDGDVEASDPPERKRRQPAQRGFQFKAGFKFACLWS
ncbi:hypothetical protein GGF50DRAFT_121386 [Schizophyllum commune]